ncbi:MAG: guanine nucleotide exchange factor, partial [Olpidium bornovanus]
ANAQACRISSFLNPAIRVLTQYPTPQPLPLVPPVSSALHMLLNFPVGAYSEIWFPNGNLGLVHRLVGMLRDSLECLLPIGNEAEPQAENPDVHGKEDTDNVLPPLAIVLTKIAAEHKEAREVLKKECLPGESDRALPVDKGRSLSARLIRLLTCIRFPKLKETVGTLFFSICEENAAEFVKEIGFGNGAGFLVMNNIPFPHPDSLSSSSPERPYDVVTGEYIDAAKRANAELAAMTDEEKEREAEKLFVLFERLNKTGVITAENPVGKAIREGKV